MSTLKKFLKDLRRTELFPVKVLMFLIYGGQATLYPYFTVHLKTSLGVGIKQTAIIFAVQPLVALLVAPVIGIYADRLGNFKLIFSFFLLFSAITANLILLVPPVDELTDGILKFHILCNLSAPAVAKVDVGSSLCIPEFNDQNATVRLKLSSCNWGHESNNSVCLRYAQNNELCIPHGSSVSALLHFPHQTDSTTAMSHCVDIYHLNYNNETFTDLTCDDKFLESNATFVLENEGAVSVCPIIRDPDEFGQTFWYYLGIRLIVTLGIGLVNGLFDASAMAVIQKYHADVGFQRFWSTISMCIFAPISGVMVDYFDTYNPCFFMYGALYVIAALTSLTLDLSMKLPSENTFSNLFQLLCNPEVVLLLVNIAALGICWGFLENFLFWFLQNELQSTNLLMGLTVTVGSGTGLFMALVATSVTRKIGYVNVIVLAFAAYTVRYIGYSYATDAYICLVYEMMENFTVTLLTVGVTMYCTELASLEMLTTMMTLWNGLHVISGRAFGSLLGGFLMDLLDARRTFRLFAYGSAVFGVFYFLMNIFWLRKWQKKREKFTKKDRCQSSVSSAEMESSFSQALKTATMHCSFDSPPIVTYSSGASDFDIRRRAFSHIPVLQTNSFRDMRIRPRMARSFDAHPRTILPNVMQTLPELDEGINPSTLESTKL